MNSPWIICWFWLDAKLIKVVSIGGGWRDVKSIGGFELETEDDIGSMAWGCWPETIIGRGDCPVELEAMHAESNMVLLEFGTLMLVKLEWTMLLPRLALNDDWESSRVSFTDLAWYWKLMNEIV